MCEHHHDHDHNHPHDHGHTGLEERVAMGDSEAAQLIHDAVVDFEVGNKKLAEALVVLKGE